MSKLVHLQVLRAFAALSVAMLHAQHDAATLAGRAGRAFTPIAAFPWEVGVDVFFVISGFIMVHASARLFAAPHGPRLFLAHRIARIVPIYWAVNTLYLVIALLAPQALNRDFLDWAYVLASYLFVPVARPDGLVQPLFALGWTLNYEMFFYVLFGLATALQRRGAVIALGAVLTAFVALGRLFAPLPQPLGFWTDPIILEFVYGMVLGLAFAEGVRLSPAVRALLGVAAVGILVAVSMHDGVLAGPSRVIAYGIPAAMLVAALAFGGNDRSAGRIGRFGAAIGDASYALYLIHPFVIRAGREIVWQTGLAGIIAPWLFVFVSLSAAVLAAVIVHRVFERPATEWLRARLRA